MKIGVQFDEQGNFVGDFLEGMTLPDGHTLFRGEIPQGLFKPIFNGAEVVEGLTQGEIDAIVNAPAPVQPIETLGKQIVALELRLLQLEGR